MSEPQILCVFIPLDLRNWLIVNLGTEEFKNIDEYFAISSVSRGDSCTKEVYSKIIDKNYSNSPAFKTDKKY